MTTTSTLAEQYSLKEPVPDQRVYAIKTQINIEGQFQIPGSDVKPVGPTNSPVKPRRSTWDMTSTANFDYLERRLGGAGRDAHAFRSARFFRGTPGARTKVGDRITASQLADPLRFLVAEGRRSGVLLYSTRQLMRREDLDLLAMPGDSLAMLTLLPANAVDVGEEWSLDTWIPQMLMHVDAVIQADLKCKLANVTGDIARIEVNGSVEGAIAGAETKVAVTGHFDFNLKQQFVSAWKIEQRETRSVGTVSPGMEVKATTTATRQPSVDSGPLTDATLATIKLDPPPEQLNLIYVTPWKTSFVHDRNWHVFHQTKQVAVMRLLDRGSLVGQLNLSPIESVQAGSRTAPSQFVADIRSSLGGQFSEIVTQEAVPQGDAMFLYRVQAKGKIGERGMNWIYYLCSASSGRQVSMVFASEDALLERLEKHDREIATSLRFLPLGK
ncbi:MAG: hypothetical protein O3A00_13655 [Planctomycetota bacterium]|nr:hypothetical protein [Planctomycetota bacterium]